MSFRSGPRHTGPIRSRIGVTLSRLFASLPERKTRPQFGEPSRASLDSAVASSKPKLVPAPKAHFPTAKQKAAQVVFGHVQGKRQSTADTQIAALVKKYQQQEKQAVAEQKAFGLKSVEDTGGRRPAFRSQTTPFHRYP